MVEDFNKLRQVSHKLVHTDFQHDYLFRLEFVGEPTDFGFFVKDISYGMLNINTDEQQCGAATITWPIARQALSVSATCRDHIDGRVRKTLLVWAMQVIHPDGTVGLPYGAGGYVRKVRIFNQTPEGAESLIAEMEMYPTAIGDTSRSYENSSLQEFPVTFTQFSTMDSVAAFSSGPASMLSASSITKSISSSLSSMSSIPGVSSVLSSMPSLPDVSSIPGASSVLTMASNIPTNVSGIKSKLTEEVSSRIPSGISSRIPSGIMSKVPSDVLSKIPSF